MLSLHTLITGILKHYKYIFKFNLLGSLGVQFVAPLSAKLAAGGGAGGAGGAGGGAGGEKKLSKAFRLGATGSN